MAVPKRKTGRARTHARRSETIRSLHLPVLCALSAVK